MQRVIQQQLADQRAAMDRARADLDRKQQEKEEQLARERERQATREWWGNPTAFSTITWGHSEGERGVQASRVEDWNVRLNISPMANAADTTASTIDPDEEIALSLEDVCNGGGPGQHPRGGGQGQERSGVGQGQGHGQQLRGPTNQKYTHQCFIERAELKYINFCRTPNQLHSTSGLVVGIIIISPTLLSTLLYSTLLLLPNDTQYDFKH